MLKFIAGVGVGVAITLVLMHFVATTPAADNFAKADKGNSLLAPSNLKTTGSTTINDSSSPENEIDEVVESDPRTHSIVEPTSTIPTIANYDENTPIQNGAAPQQIVDSTSGQASSSTPSQNNSSIDVIETLVPLSEAHQKALENSRSRSAPITSIHGAHDMFEREILDETWSYYVEQQLQNFLPPAAAAVAVELHYIGCRSTLCEIQASWYDQSTSRQWMEVMRKMEEQPWWSEFEGAMNFVAQDNDSMINFTFLQRKKASE